MIVPEPSTQEFETIVLDEFRARLLEFCATWRGGRSSTIRATVVTVRPVPDLRETLDPLARRILAVELPAARFDGVLFATDSRLPYPGHRVTVVDPGGPPPGPPPGAAPKQRINDPEPATRVAHLTLSYGDKHRYSYPLVSAAEWLAIRRGKPAPAHRRELPLPNHLNVVPGGSLLGLRFWRGRAEVVRTAERPEYTIWVDQLRLAPGQPSVLEHAGEIVYAFGDRRTVLTYLLTGLE